jgi:hypothetical protein
VQTWEEQEVRTRKPLKRRKRMEKHPPESLVEAQVLKLQVRA